MENLIIFVCFRDAFCLASKCLNLYNFSLTMGFFFSLSEHTAFFSQSNAAILNRFKTAFHVHLLNISLLSSSPRSFPNSPFSPAALNYSGENVSRYFRGKQSYNRLPSHPPFTPSR